MFDVSVRESRCVETSYTTLVKPAHPYCEMPELPVGFLRRDIRVNMDDGGVARIVILDVESPFQITPH